MNAPILLIAFGHLGLHRFYLYDQKGGRKILEIFILLYLALIIPTSYFYLAGIPYFFLSLLICWLALVFISNLRLKRDVKLINEEVKYYD